MRIAGIIAFVLTSMLAVMLSYRIKSVSASGRFETHSDGSSYIYLITANRTRNVFDRGTAPAYPGTFGLGGHGNIFVNIEVPLPNLPEGCTVDITHRWIVLLGKAWTSTVVVHEGEIYPLELSPAVFFGTLSLIALAPVILWGCAALLCLRKISHPIQVLPEE